MSASLVAVLPAAAFAAAAEPSRKRRLDHLSWEEKLLRKKLKNRVAAQTSRDRKKAKMDEMEARMDKLEKTNVRLNDEMRSLRELNERLAGENAELKKKLSSANTVAVADPSGSAESRPLPKEGSATTAATALCHLTTLFLLSKISSLGSTPASISSVSKSSPTAFSERLTRKLLTEIPHNSRLMLKAEAVHRKWWGPQQSSWNPAETKA